MIFGMKMYKLFAAYYWLKSKINLKKKNVFKKIKIFNSKTKFKFWFFI